MNKKHFFCGLACMATLSTPVTMTSCNEDEIVSAINTLDAIMKLFNNSNALAGTIWTNNDESFQIQFTDNSTGYIYDPSISQEVVAFNYTMNSDNQTITLTYNNTSEVLTVTAYEQNKALQIKRGSRTYDLVPLTE